MPVINATFINKFSGWRSDKTPSMDYTPTGIDGSLFIYLPQLPKFALKNKPALDVNYSSNSSDHLVQVKHNTPLLMSNENLSDNPRPILVEAVIPTVYNDKIVFKNEDERLAVEAICFSKFVEANQLMEFSVSDVALSYVASQDPNNTDDDINPKKGPVLEYASTVSKRYLDLLTAYVKMEKQRGLPMLSLQAGLLKQHGFITEEILDMQPAAKYLLSLYTSAAPYLNGAQEHMDFEKMLTNKNSRQAYLADANNHPELIQIARQYQAEIDKTEKLLAAAENFFNGKTDKYNDFKNTLENKVKRDAFIVDKNNDPQLIDLAAKYEKIARFDLIERAYFLMSDFGHMSAKEIKSQLDDVATMRVDENANEQQRLRMEIRHRIAGDYRNGPSNTGEMTNNPIAYLNLVLDKLDTAPQNLEGEFRNKMYFTYMLNHFANAVIRDDETINDLSDIMQENGCQWQLDKEFIQALRDRGPKYIPPIFRYGANADLNRSSLRSFASAEESEAYYKAHPMPTIESVKSGSKSNGHFRFRLTLQEQLRLTCQLPQDYDPNKHNRLYNYSSGAAIFKVARSANDVDNQTNAKAKEYVSIVEQLKLPVSAGISGTLDQSTAMAGLVGIGVDENDKSDKELHTIKLAYLAFMLASNDHTIHEIMQSSKTYGLAYVAGPGSEQYLYPIDTNFVAKVEQAQRERGVELPGYYYSKEYILKALKQVRDNQSVKQNSALGFLANSSLVANSNATLLMDIDNTEVLQPQH